MELTTDPRAGGKRKSRLLIVEDESLIALDLKRRLTRAGYEVLEIADNLEGALAEFSAGQPDLILMDVHVRGDADGIEIARAIGQLGDVPVIFLTAYADDDTIQRAAETSPYGYLLKPFDDRTLAATIKVALERHAADTRLRVLGGAVEHATLGIVLIDTRGHQRRSVFCNDAFCRLSGVTREDAMAFDPCFLYPEDEQDDSLRLREALVRRAPFEATLRGRRESGEEFWSSVCLSPVPDRSGNVTHMIAFHVDITPQREAEEALARSQRLELIGRLSAGIAHDFNNILSAIMGYSELAALGLGEQRQKAHLDGVIHAAERGALLTRKLLDHSRSRSAVKSGTADLLKVVEQNFQMTQRLAGPAIRIRLSLDSEPMFVRLDATSLEQILFNLVANARDAMPDGGEIAIAVSRISAATDAPSGPQTVRLAVTDTGKGMDALTSARIFEPFFTTKALGTGLGLATCRMLAEQAGGSMRASSELGKGTQVLADFPLAPPVAIKPTGGTTPAIFGHAGGARCLLVEEDALLRRASAQALQHAGFVVIEAPSAEAACRELTEQASALTLMICDMTQSGRPAAEVFALARELAPGMELIATSGHVGQAVTDCGPGVSLLWKPFAATTLARWALDALGAVAPALVPDLLAPLPALRPVSANVPQSPKVLVIDDDDGVRKYLAELLELEQFVVVQAATATEGLAAARQHELQLAIIDVVLPDGDGIQLLDGLREVDPLLPMLIVSGQASVESAQRAMQRRAAGMLLKPIAPDVFQQTVERVLKEGQLQRLQHKLLMARSEYQPLVLDLPNTERQFAESLAQVYVVFQPLVRAHDKSTYAFEALLRSHGPMSSPADLIEAAEILGRIEELGRQIRGCISRVLTEHPSRFEPVFVNLHPSEFRAELLLREDEPLLPFAPRIVWEVTERAQISLREEDVTSTVAQLRAMGYRVAIDDLGEGYAGLSLLVSLAPDVAKIDMSLVRGLEQSHMKRALVSSLVSVCHRARTLVVAEGVETEVQAALLSEMGCDLLQGYWFARPGPPFPGV